MPDGSGRARAARPGSIRRVPIVAALLVAACAGGARAQFERSSLTPLAVAAGGASVSSADDISSIFFNPAGLAPTAGPILYADYGETRGPRRGREARAAAAADARFVRCALAWYRLDREGGADDLLVAGCARTLVSGSQGSYVAIGANVGLGRIAGSPLGGGDPAWTGAAVDAGIVARPLPVVSFAWAGGNLFEAKLPANGGENTWGRTNRFGVSYFWEDALVFSFESAHAPGGTTKHYGVRARTATPVEILFGLSAGEMTGGARWNGERVRCTVAFDGGGAGGATWTVALEASLGAPGKEDR